MISLPLLDPLGGEGPLVEGVVNEDLRKSQQCWVKGSLPQGGAGGFATRPSSELVGRNNSGPICSQHDDLQAVSIWESACGGQTRSLSPR